MSHEALGAAALQKSVAAAKAEHELELVIGVAFNIALAYLGRASRSLQA